MKLARGRNLNSGTCFKRNATKSKYRTVNTSYFGNALIIDEKILCLEIKMKDRGRGTVKVVHPETTVSRYFHPSFEGDPYSTLILVK